MIEHTPKPWRVTTAGEIVTSAGLTIAKLPVGRVPDLERLANGKLIVTSPDMAELIQDLIDYHGGNFKKHRDLHSLVSRAGRLLEVATP